MAGRFLDQGCKQRYESEADLLKGWFQGQKQHWAEAKEEIERDWEPLEDECEENAGLRTLTTRRLDCVLERAKLAWVVGKDRAPTELFEAVPVEH